MFKSHYQIGMATVVLLVALRLSIGCHFLYEGVWKIQHAEEFSATPFLTMAKGPAAPLFYAMVPDLDGRERLRIEKDAKGNAVITGQCFLEVWKQLQADTADKYGLSDQQKARAAKIHGEYARGLKSYLAENQEDVAAYFGSLDRFEAQQAAETDGSDYRKKRTWDRQQELRKEADGWLTSIDAMGKSYQASLWSLLNDNQRKLGRLPVATTFSDMMDFAVTYGLTAIGLCMVIGLFTRFACLGGAAFLVSVLLTQPPWPTIYPPFPAALGHALVVDKNFVEMVAMLVLASTAVGRWGGLDYFVENYASGMWELLKDMKKKVGGK